MKLRPASPDTVPAISWLQRLGAGVFLLVQACGPDLGPPDQLVRAEERSSALVQKCTATNISGNPYKGQLCGRAFIDNCTSGLIYTCSGGRRGTTNNCTLATSC